MKAKIRAALALLALVVTAAVTVGYSGVDMRTRSHKFSRQAGGSTGDSIQAAADTSNAIFVPNNAKGVWISMISACSTSVRIFVDVSDEADSMRSTEWVRYSTDSTAAGDDNVFFTTRTTEALLAKSGALRGKHVRVVTDPINAPQTTGTIKTFLEVDEPR